MSSRRMGLLPRTALHSDSEQKPSRQSGGGAPCSPSNTLDLWLLMHMIESACFQQKNVYIVVQAYFKFSIEGHQ
jgi:hypothetical protein